MKKLVLTICFAAATAGVACSSVSSNTGNNANAAVRASSNAAAPAIAVETPAGARTPAPGLTPMPPGSVEPTPGPPADANVNTNANTFTRRAPKGVEHAGPVPPPPFRPGPDGSQVATTQNKDGQPLEIRVFKRNMPFTRVEATWLDATNRIVKFTLKTGKVVEVRTDKLAALGTAPVAQLLELAKQAK